MEPPEYGTRHFAVGGAVPSPLETISLLRGNFAGGGDVPTLRAGQDAYGAALQQTAGGVPPPPPSAAPGMSQTDFNARKPVDADKVARQQEQLRKMLEARGAKPVKKAKGGAIRLHPSLHHHIAHALIKMAAEGAK